LRLSPRLILTLGAAAVVAASLNMALATSPRDAVEVVHFPTASGQMPPLILRGFLRRPPGNTPSPAVVLLHGCGGDPEGLDRNWGARFQSWGYVSLTVDAFGPRGLTNSCRSGIPAGRVFDPYGALQFLSNQPFVDSSRVALVGFSEGGALTLDDVEPKPHQTSATLGFRAAVAFYPICAGTGIVTVPTLIVNGELDDWSSADACKKMVAQESDIGITRHKGASAPTLVILPGAHHKFDDPKFQPGRRYIGHLLEYNSAALRRAADDVHRFLNAVLAIQ
jgi:dienelactone hydrolase